MYGITVHNHMLNAKMVKNPPLGIIIRFFLSTYKNITKMIKFNGFVGFKPSSQPWNFNRCHPGEQKILLSGTPCHKILHNALKAFMFFSCKCIYLISKWQIYPLKVKLTDFYRQLKQLADSSSNSYLDDLTHSLLFVNIILLFTIWNLIHVFLF